MNSHLKDLIVEGKAFPKQYKSANRTLLPRAQELSASLLNFSDLSELEKAEIYQYPIIYYAGHSNRSKRNTRGEYDDARGKNIYIYYRNCTFVGDYITSKVVCCIQERDYKIREIILCSDMKYWKY